MTEQEQRIAIAEAAGFTNVHRAEHGTWCGIAPGSLSELTWPLPDYLHDLNAMHSALLTMTPLQQDACAAILSQLVDGRIIDYGNTRIETTTKVLFASAAQQAEAMCRVLWPERWGATP